MTKLKVINKTPLKSRAIPFIELQPKYLYWLDKGTEIDVEILKEKDRYYEVKLFTNFENSPVGIRSWFIYKEHVEVIEDKKKKLGKNVLKTDYYYQLDNDYEPYTSCFLTCVAMLLSFYKVKVTPDVLYNKCLDSGYDRFSWEDITEILKSYGVQHYSTTTGTAQELKDVVTKAPVILGTYLTEASHIVLVVGYDDSAYGGRGAFIINDPYGEFTHNGYIHTPTAGKNTLYSFSLIAQVGAPEGDGNYWLHLPE